MFKVEKLKTTIKQYSILKGQVLDVDVRVYPLFNKIKIKIFFKGKTVSKTTKKIDWETLEFIEQLRKGAIYFENLCGGSGYLTLNIENEKKLPYRISEYTLMYSVSSFENKLKKQLLKQKKKEMLK